MFGTPEGPRHVSRWLLGCYCVTGVTGVTDVTGVTGVR